MKNTETAMINDNDLSMAEYNSELEKADDLENEFDEIDQDSKSQEVIARSFPEFLKKVGKYPLLKAEEEIDLARKIKAGDQKAKDQLINSNLRLVVGIAKFYNRADRSIDDLVQEGVVGLVKATEKFDHRKGFRFSTYATQWIRQAIVRSISEKGQTIRFPEYANSLLKEINKTADIFFCSHGREPSLEELSALTKIKINSLTFFLQAMNWVNIISFSTCINSSNDGSLSVIDAIEDEAPGPDERTVGIMLAEGIELNLSLLNSQQEIIIRLRFGLTEAGCALSLQEVGLILGLSRERIRQIERDALNCLRSAPKPKEDWHDLRQLAGIEDQTVSNT